MSRSTTFIPSRPQAEILNVLSRIFMASRLAADVDGHGDFFDHYLDHELTPRQRAIWRAFQDHVRVAQSDAAWLMENESPI